MYAKESNTVYNCMRCFCACGSRSQILSHIAGNNAVRHCGFANEFKWLDALRHLNEQKFILPVDISPHKPTLHPSAMFTSPTTVGCVVDRTLRYKYRARFTGIYACGDYGNPDKAETLPQVLIRETRILLSLTEREPRIEDLDGERSFFISPLYSLINILTFGHGARASQTTGLSFRS